MRYAARVANPISAIFLRFARRLRFPTLFFLTAGLFALDLAVPDMVPFVDELLLGLGTLLLGSLRKRLDAGRDTGEEGDG